MATRSATGTCSQYERSSLRSCSRRLVTTRPRSRTRAGSYLRISLEPGPEVSRTRAEIRVGTTDPVSPSAALLRPIRVGGAAPHAAVPAGPCRSSPPLPSACGSGTRSLVAASDAVVSVAVIVSGGGHPVARPRPAPSRRSSVAGVVRRRRHEGQRVRQRRSPRCGVVAHGRRRGVDHGDRHTRRAPG